jgi:lipoprotein NlpD
MMSTDSIHMTPSRFCRHGAVLATWVLVLLGAGCAQRGVLAPVEDRSANKPAAPAVVTTPQAPPSASAPSAEATPAVNKPPLGIENSGKPGYYAVKPGDTLIRIGLDSGQNWRDVARWNGLDNPNVIEVGQVLRVVPPGPENNGVAVAKPVVPATKPEVKPLDPKAATATGTTPPAGSTPAGTTVVAAPSPATSPAARESEDELNWMWPANGPVGSGFEEAKTNGVDIVGKAGDPIFAAADGRVIYAGGGVRGYGNLIILKHNNTYLTAYAHNQAVFVKEEQVVKRGQKIAEMGNTDAERVQLHFEIRRRGKPIDPAKLLPAR